MYRLLRAASALFLLAAILLAACGGGGDDPTELTLTHVAANELGTVPAGTRVFRSQAEWVAFWAAHPHGGYPARQVPVVDFGRFAVAGVFAGPKGRCNRLDITAGTRLAEVVTLRWRISTFGASTPSSCIGSDMFTLNLADLVLLPQDVLEVRFEQE